MYRYMLYNYVLKQTQPKAHFDLVSFVCNWNPVMFCLHKEKVKERYAIFAPTFTNISHIAEAIYVNYKTYCSKTHCIYFLVFKSTSTKISVDTDQTAY